MLILERFEDRFAIIENGDKRLEVDISSVAPEVKEGDVLIMINGRYVADKEATIRTQKRNNKAAKRIMELTMDAEVIIIGGGAAGAMAGIHSGRLGNKTIILEPNGRIGKKLLITGKGRCNVTNNCSSEELIRNIPRNSRFLYQRLFTVFF